MEGQRSCRSITSGKITLILDLMKRHRKRGIRRKRERRTISFILDLMRRHRKREIKKQRETQTISFILDLMKRHR